MKIQITLLLTALLISNANSNSNFISKGNLSHIIENILALKSMQYAKHFLTLKCPNNFSSESFDTNNLSESLFSLIQIKANKFNEALIIKHFNHNIRTKVEEFMYPEDTCESVDWTFVNKNFKDELDFLTLNVNSLKPVSLYDQLRLREALNFDYIEVLKTLFSVSDTVSFGTFYAEESTFHSAHGWKNKLDPVTRVKKELMSLHSVTEHDFKTNNKVIFIKENKIISSLNSKDLPLLNRLFGKYHWKIKHKLIEGKVFSH